MSLYRDGRFTEAAKAFKEAYVLAGDDVLLLNAARSWEKAGDREAAAKLYIAVGARKDLTVEIKRKAAQGLARLTAPPIVPLPAAAGTWIGTASLGKEKSTISITLAPGESGTVAGALYAPGFRCGGTLVYTSTRKDTWRFEVGEAVGGSWCEKLKTVQFHRTGPETARLDWTHVDAGRFTVVAQGEAPPTKAVVSRSSRTISKKPSGTSGGSDSFVIAGDIAAADEAMQAALSWVGARIRIDPNRGRGGMGKLIGVRGSVLIIALDGGKTWTGDVMDLTAITHYPTRKR